MKIPEAVVGAVVPGTTDTIDVVQRPWWYVLRLIRAYPLLYFLSFLGIFAMYVWPVIPANLIRRLFDTLEHPETGVDPRNMVWLLAALLVAQVLARSVTVLGWPAERGLLVAGTALMRHNLLRRILQRPGASALPPGSSPGEAISRLRDDLEHVIHFVDWTADPIGQVTIVSIALVTLMRIDPWITAIAFVPLVMLLTVINWVNRRIQLTRKASAESISAVTGLLGELFGAAQAIKVTGSETRVVAHLQRAGERR